MTYISDQSGPLSVYHGRVSVQLTNHNKMISRIFLPFLFTTILSIQIVFNLILIKTHSSKKLKRKNNYLQILSLYSSEIHFPVGFQS